MDEEKKVINCDDKFIVPIQELCAINRSGERRFFLNDVCPSVKYRIDMLDRENFNFYLKNGSYNCNNYNSTLNKILYECELPYAIPFKVLRRKMVASEECYVCRELFYNKFVFVLPKSILNFKYDSMDNVSLYINAKVSMETLFDIYKWVLNHPENNELNCSCKRRTKK